MFTDRCMIVSRYVFVFTDFWENVLMLRYVSAAVVLKLFSVSDLTAGWYRKIGNILETGLRLSRGISGMYLDRARLLLRLLEKHVGLRKGQRALELGTGWVHWDSVIIRLFYEINISLYDVSDCRTLKAFKHTWAEFSGELAQTLNLPAAEQQRVQALLRNIADTRSFDDVYELLGFEYVLDPTGQLNRVEDNAYDLVFSFHVMEHVPRGTMPEFLRNMHRILKPGGHCIHKIDLCDHLAYYDRPLLPKQYLAYSDRVWKALFENKVQYVNRLQRPEWLSLFEDAGFALLDEEHECQDIRITPDRRFGAFSKKDLDCSSLLVVLRKPAVR